ncbi:transcription initiation factor TFIID component TAF4 family-domain-containing protein [Sporodiniella umbellata]|nr:transcription initiation factor TFIID component TAF4 family-domain-containing protein [Sporodiniella umbellata]
MAEEGFNNQQQQRNLIHEELNFSINDILNGSADINDSSFQSIVQTLSETNHDPSVTSSFANLPTELQDFFSASDTDDLLSTQHNTHDLLFDPHPFIQPVRVNVPSSIPVLAPTQTHIPATTQDLQASSISAAEFMTQSKSILGDHQYRLLEDLKSKPTAQSSVDDDKKKRKTNPQSLRYCQNIQKRPKSDHIPTPMYPPQSTRIQSHISPILPQQYPIQPNIATPNIAKPVFKAPSPILQIPSKANVSIPSINLYSKPPITQNIAQTGSSGGGNNNSGGGDRVDYDTLTDVMGYAGVDLKEEAEHFAKEDLSGTVLPDGMDRSKFQDFMNPNMLKDKILKYTRVLNIKKIDSDFVSYLALATQDRVRTVLENMVRASRHRTQNSFEKPPEQDGYPMYKIYVKQKVEDQLKAIENAESCKNSSPKEEKREGLGWHSKKTNRSLFSIEKKRMITVQDAVFVMERDVQGGRGSNRRTLLKAYNSWSN